MTTESPVLPVANPLPDPVKRVPPINSNNARELQRLAAESRRKNTLARLEAAEAAKNPPQPKQTNANDVQIGRIERHIARLDDLLEKDDKRTPAEWRDLTQARARLFADWQTLTGLERPGVRKVSKRPAPTAIDPITEPTPQQLVDVPIFGRQNIAV